MFDSHASHSFVFSDRLRAARRRQECPSRLLADCEAWLAGCHAEEWSIRAGRHAIAQQLDTLDKAKLRVETIANAARNLIAAER